MDEPAAKTIPTARVISLKSPAQVAKVFNDDILHYLFALLVSCLTLKWDDADNQVIHGTLRALTGTCKAFRSALIVKYLAMRNFRPPSRDRTRQKFTVFLPLLVDVDDSPFKMLRSLSLGTIWSSSCYWIHKLQPTTLVSILDALPLLEHLRLLHLRWHPQFVPRMQRSLRSLVLSGLQRIAVSRAGVGEYVDDDRNDGSVEYSAVELLRHIDTLAILNRITTYWDGPVVYLGSGGLRSGSIANADMVIIEWPHVNPDKADRSHPVNMITPTWPWYPTAEQLVLLYQPYTALPAMLDRLQWSKVPGSQEDSASHDASICLREIHVELRENNEGPVEEHTVFSWFSSPTGLFANLTLVSVFIETEPCGIRSNRYTMFSVLQAFLLGLNHDGPPALKEVMVALGVGDIAEAECHARLAGAPWKLMVVGIGLKTGMPLLEHLTIGLRRSTPGGECFVKKGMNARLADAKWRPWTRRLRQAVEAELSVADAGMIRYWPEGGDGARVDQEW